MEPQCNYTNREWTNSEDYKIQTTEENYNLYTYTKNGSLNTIDLVHMKLIMNMK